MDKVREIFIDTNILIDLASEREPNATYASALFVIAGKKSIVMNICALSYNNVHYIIKKRFGRAKAKTTIQWLSKFTKCLPVNNAIVNQAIVSQFRDFEDAIQYHCALQIPKCEAIITRNIKDFKWSNIPVKYPESFWIDEVSIKPYL